MSSGKLSPTPGNHASSSGPNSATASKAIEQSEQARPAKPTPTVADFRYGPHPRNVFDLWLPPNAGQPVPLVIYIHGGGFQKGDKDSLKDEVLAGYLDSGYALAALNYRLTDTAPAPAAYLDCARAVQTLRHHAAEWKLDPARLAFTGGSAGGGTSLWLGFHPDLADPRSDDPIARHSTHVNCIAIRNAQPSYDPRYGACCGIPRPNFERHSFFSPFHGVKTTTPELDSPEAHRRYEANAGITYLSKAAPPVWIHYTHPDGDTNPESEVGWVVHHPRLGLELQKRMRALGLTCEIVIENQSPGDWVPQERAFVQRCLQ